MLRVGLGAALSFLQNESGVRIPAVKAMNHRGGFSSIPRRWSGVVNYELEELHAKKTLGARHQPSCPFPSPFVAHGTSYNIISHETRCWLHEPGCS